VDEKLEKSLLKITDAIRKQIISLHSLKSSGNIDITVRLSMTQGFIGAAKIRNVAEENIFQTK
jgi:hypothetical protein